MAPFLLPFLFTAGSMGANYIGDRQASQAQADAMAAERERQRQIEEEMFRLNDSSVGRYADAGKGIQQESSQLADVFRDITRTAPERPVAGVPQSGNVSVRNASKAAQSADQARADDDAQRRANMRGFGSFLGDAALGQNQDGNRMSTLSGFSRGSQSVLPLELQAALEQGGGWRMLGDLLQLGAGVTTQNALMGAPGSTPTELRLPRILTIGDENSLFGGNSWGA